MAGGSTYEEQHNSFVTSLNGCSPIEILQVLASVSLMPFLTSLTIPWIVPSSFTKMTANSPRAFACVKAVVEYPLVLLAPIFFITVFAGPGVEEMNETDDKSIANPLPLSSCVVVTLTLICVGIITVNQAITRPAWSGFKGEWNKLKGKRMNWSSARFSLEKEVPTLPNKNSGRDGSKLPFVTNFRGIITLMTVISILAVDLVIFPRRFAKTKTVGFSLMDVGTGSFMFMNAIVSPEARNMKANLLKSLKSSIPLIILGIIRLVTVKGMEYPEVVEEYGVHWNFFFSLAAIKISSALLFSIFPSRSSLKLACIIGILYDVVIVSSGYQDSYILNPKIPRDSGLIDANREGIFSIPGYLTIYLASIYIGQVMFNTLRDRRTIEDWAYYGGQSGAQIFILLGLAFFSHTFWSPVCRRSANLSYVLWIISSNYTILWLQFALCFFQVVIQHLGLLHGPLLFYELRQKSLKKFEAFVKTKEEEANDMRNEDKESLEEEQQMEATLDLLALKLDKIQQEVRSRKNPEDKIELADFTKEVEKEMETVGAKCLAKELKKVGDDMKSKTTAGDLVEMPDFTRPSVLLEGICFNGLGVFLLGNLLTGLINSLVYSMYIPSSTGLIFLWTYVSVIGFISFGLYWFNVQIKFW